MTLIMFLPAIISGFKSIVFFYRFGEKCSGICRYLQNVCLREMWCSGRFPGDGGVVAPGMNCQYTVRFAPDSLADYEDFLVVETQSPYPLIIPVQAHRPPPVLTCRSMERVSCLTHLKNDHNFFTFPN